MKMKSKAWARRALFSAMAVSALGAAVACSSSSDEGGDAKFGELRLPLATQGASGTEYRLRDATFEITRYCYWDCYDDGYGGEGGSSSQQAPVVVGSEDDPSATSISVSLEQGDYMVRLLPGWRMEQLGDGSAETVEATLLSSGNAWVWISPHSTSWAEFRFGIGSKEIWLNGQLNIEIEVYEDPDEYYGNHGGAGGTTGGWGGDGG